MVDHWPATCVGRGDHIVKSVAPQNFRRQVRSDGLSGHVCRGRGALQSDDNFERIVLGQLGCRDAVQRRFDRDGVDDCSRPEEKEVGIVAGRMDL